MLKFLETMLSETKTSNFVWTPDDIRIERISKFLEWHRPHKVRKKMLENLLGPKSALLDVRYCPKLQSFAISRKIMMQT